MGETDLEPNYVKTYETVLQVIHICQLQTLPISLEQIIHNTKGLRLISYSAAIQDKECSIKEWVNFIGSDLGAYVTSSDKKKSIIFYNDTKNNQGLDRFTIAHELGHHFLGHSEWMQDGQALKRGLNDKEYDVIEKEANCFARNLLSPIYLLNMIGISPYELERVKKIFDISHQAALIRKKAYMIDLAAMTEKGRMIMEHQFQSQIMFYQRLNICLSCNNILPEGFVKYCPICNSQKFIKYKRKNVTMKYVGPETNENDKLLICPKCGNEEIEEAGDYCKICGFPLVNFCASTIVEGSEGEQSIRMPCEKGRKLPSNARYCPYCGNETSFLQNKILEKVKLGDPIVNGLSNKGFTIIKY